MAQNEKRKRVVGVTVQTAPISVYKVNRLFFFYNQDLSVFPARYELNL